MSPSLSRLHKRQRLSSSPLPPFSSPFASHDASLTIHLHPSRLHQVEEGIREHLHTLLLTYQPALHGLPIAFDRLTLPESKLGSIFYDRPFINFRVTVRFLVLTLVNKGRLEGRVHHVSAERVAMLLYSTFYVFLSKKDWPSYFQLQRNDSEDTLASAVLIDTRYVDADDPVEESKVNNNSHVKASKKAQAKEARRQAYLASQGIVDSQRWGDVEPVSAKGKARTKRDEQGRPCHWHHCQKGSLVRFSIDSVSVDEGVVSIGGVFAHPDDGVVPCELTESSIHREQREWSERLAAETAEQRQPEYEFGAISSSSHLHAAETVEQRMMEEHVAAASGHLLVDHSPKLTGMQSKKEAIEAKDTDRDERRAAKAERRRLRAAGIQTLTTNNEAAAATAEQSVKKLKLAHFELKEAWKPDSSESNYFVIADIDEHKTGHETAISKTGSTELHRSKKIKVHR